MAGSRVRVAGDHALGYGGGTMSGKPAKPLTADDEPDPWKRMEAATLELRRRTYRATTPGERIERAFDLNEIAIELREGMGQGSE